MDPITRAMRRLTAGVDAFWRSHPSRVLPLTAAEEHRAHVAQAIRLGENAQDNRRLFIVFEGCFTDADTYFFKLVDEITEHYELFRVGLAEDGVQVPPFVRQNETIPSGALARAALAMERAAWLLGDRFDGIVVALVPEHIVDPTAWLDSARALAAIRWTPRVRVAVLVPPGVALEGIAGNEGVRFQLDQGELIAFLMQLPEPAAAEPSIMPGETHDRQSLGALLLRAAEALSAQRADEAAQLYREARARRRVEGLAEGEASVLAAFAGACLACGAPALAADSYQQAANRSELVPARIEALRMAGICFLELGREDEALLAWKEAVDVGAEAAERGASTFEEVGRSLVKLLNRRGLHEQAQHVLGLVEERLPCRGAMQ